MEEKNLVIVESPAKAKTIEKFLGKDFLVKSSYGHVRDLPKKGLSIDIDNGFQPQYVISEDKKDVIKELKKLVKEAETVWLATDEDREGEAISWHLKEALDLDEKKTRRITFNEITKNAIEEAIQNPRDIDQGLVRAQQARRVLDRLVGFELSPVLWKKVRPSLSAGRVQSVAVRLLVEREREIRAFEPKASFKVTAEFDPGGGKTVRAELPHRFDKVEDAEAFLAACADSTPSIEKLETKPGKRKPAPPFTTSTLQQEASRKLGYSVSKTMTVAQQLYESGWITYMRTDSVNLSNTAIKEAKNTVIKDFGENYSEPRNFTTKAEGAQEAHEAIRPVSVEKDEADGNADQQRLYDLIRKRTLASQMAEAKLKKTTATIALDGSEEKFVAKGEVLEFDGFLRVYAESTDEDDGEEEDEKVLPPLEEGQELTLLEARATERFTKHPPRYTEASLVKKLEELGIGRPSTYAPIISTVQKRGYVVKEDRPGTKRDFRTLMVKPGTKVEHEKGQETTGAEKQKLFPTDMGMVVNDFLMENFKEIMDYNFTASVEKQFDEIASGDLKWDKMIRDFYQPFHKEVEETIEHSERATGERELGTDPDSGRPIIARIGKYGPMVQIGKQEDEEKPRFASLRSGQSIEEITLEEALDLFKLPRDLGEYQGESLSASIGRFGPYVRLGNTFASLKQDEGDDPYTVDRDRAIELIEEKKKAIRERTIQTFEEDDQVQVLKGKWGPYVKIGKKNYKVPKDKDPAALTLEECYEIARNAPAKKKGKKKSGGKKK
jgi:DNA topoisomerase-1